jgi:hypothetical protein
LAAAPGHDSAAGGCQEAAAAGRGARRAMYAIDAAGLKLDAAGGVRHTTPRTF